MQYSKPVFRNLAKFMLLVYIKCKRIGLATRYLGLLQALRGAIVHVFAGHMLHMDTFKQRLRKSIEVAMLELHALMSLL